MSKQNSSYDEMMVHIPLCSHNNIQKLLVVGKVSDGFKTQVSKHDIAQIDYVDTICTDTIYDVILYNGKISNISELALVQNSLNQEDGILVCAVSFAQKNLDKLKDEINLVSEKFWISMPYGFGHNTLLFNSHKFHPQSNIILQVSDLLEDCDYYNTELHNACFVYPNNIHNELTGIAKR